MRECYQVLNAPSLAGKGSLLPSLTVLVHVVPRPLLFHCCVLLFQEVLISHVYTKASKQVVLKMLSIFFQLLIIFCQEAQAFGVSAGHLCWQVRSAG